MLYSILTPLQFSLYIFPENKSKTNNVSLTFHNLRLTITFNPPLLPLLVSSGWQHNAKNKVIAYSQSQTRTQAKNQSELK